ncbi:MAG: hypothetical protein WA144_01450, partial [Candidatus Methanoperedens sp.]
MAQMENKSELEENVKLSAELLGNRKGKKRRAIKKEKVPEEKNQTPEIILKPEIQVEKPGHFEDKNKINVIQPEKEPSGEKREDLKSDEKSKPEHKIESSKIESKIEPKTEPKIEPKEDFKEEPEAGSIKKPGESTNENETKPPLESPNIENPLKKPEKPSENKTESKK